VYSGREREADYSPPPSAELDNNADEVTEEWRKLHDEELYDLYSSPSIIRIFKSRRIRLVGHVA
jgi:hypothetical protein